METLLERLWEPLQGFQVPLGSIEPNGGKARDIVARQIGLSSTTFQRALKIMARGIMG